MVESPSLDYNLPSLQRARSSSEKSGKFFRSLSIPSNMISVSQPTTPIASGTSKARFSPLSSRSNSNTNSITNIPAIPSTVANPLEKLSLGKKLKKKLSTSSEPATQLYPSSRSRSSSIRKSSISTTVLAMESSSTAKTSPIFNTAYFSDITEDYFKYSSRRLRNKSIASESSLCPSSVTKDSLSSQHDPLEPYSAFEENDSLYSNPLPFLSTTSLQAQAQLPLHSQVPPAQASAEALNLSLHIPHPQYQREAPSFIFFENVSQSADDKEEKNHDRDNYENAEEEKEEEELAESMAFDILRRTKQISLTDGSGELTPS